MESQKRLFGILANWNDVRGFGFVVERNPNGTRRSWFLHVTRITAGTPTQGCKVFFDEEPNPKGPLAVNAECGQVVPKFVDVADALAGKTGIGGGE